MPQKNGPERTENGRFGPGNHGRPRGIPTRKTQEIKEFARQVLMAENPQLYLKNVRQRIFRGEAPHMEKFFAEHLWGKPKESIEVSGTVTHEHVIIEKLAQAKLLAASRRDDLACSA